MDVLALLIALLALVIALLAYIRVGGKEEIRKQVEDLGVKTESAREKTADMIERIEEMVRGKAKPDAPAAGAPDAEPQPPTGGEAKRSPKRRGDTP